MSDQTPGVPPIPLPPTHQSTYEPTSSYESPGYQAVTYPSPTHETLTTLTPPTRRSSGVAAILVLVLGAVVVLTGAGAGVYALSQWVGEQQGVDGPGGPSAADDPAADDPADRPLAPLVSAAGFDQLLDALKKETGSTSVVDLTVYPRYAVAVVPVPGGKGRTERLYFDGTFREQGLGTSDDPIIDLRRVDPELLVTLSRKARNAVEDPNSWYLIIGAPDAQGAAIYAYASNAYGEGGYVAADLGGRIVNRVGW